jgi:hypothetical protein
VVALPPLDLALVLALCAVASYEVLALFLRVRAVALACGNFCAVEILRLAALLALQPAFLLAFFFALLSLTPLRVPARTLYHFGPFQQHDDLAFSSVVLCFLPSLAPLLVRSASLTKACRVSSWVSSYPLPFLVQHLSHSDPSRVKVDRVFSSAAPPLLLYFLHFCLVTMVDRVSFEACPPALQFPLAHLL